MLKTVVVPAIAAATVVAAQQPGEDGRYTISAPGIKAQVRTAFRLGAAGF